MIQVDPVLLVLIVGLGFAVGLLLGFIGGHRICDEHYQALLKSVKEGTTRLV